MRRPPCEVLIDSILGKAPESEWIMRVVILGAACGFTLALMLYSKGHEVTL